MLSFFFDEVPHGLIREAGGIGMNLGKPDGIRKTEGLATLAFPW